MKDWKIIIGLILVIIVLLVSLGFKVMNNTPENQMQEFTNNYNEQKLENNLKTEINLSGIFALITKGIKIASGLIVLSGLITLFFTLVNVKIYNKLGIEGLPIKLYIIINIVSFLVGFTFNSTLIAVINVISGIIGIVLLVMEYKIIGVNPYLLLLVFIPFAGIFAIFIIAIYATWMLGEYFGKGTGFKLGLIFLPMIFNPILAFSRDE